MYTVQYVGFLCTVRGNLLYSMWEFSVGICFCGDTVFENKDFMKVFSSKLCE